MSLLLTVDRHGTLPLWKQIVTRVTQLVDDGTLPPGSRLPPTRSLALTLEVNRSTVCRAYEELWALGYLVSRPGSYSTVRGRARPLMAGDRSPSLVDWSGVATAGARRAYDHVASLASLPSPKRGWVDFASLSADASLCPADELRRAARHVLLEHGSALLDYGDPSGYRPLRDTLARRLRTHGVAVLPDDILVTHGAQQALELVLKTFVRPGGSVLVEAPTYGLMIPLLQLFDTRPIQVPMGPDGMDLDQVEGILGKERPDLVYTMPTFQNPTGITTSQAHRERLLSLCETHRVPILEDGFEEEMKYFGKAVLPIKSMDAHGIVIYVGTFSKVIFPGLRIGWIAADRECSRRLTMVSRFCALSGSTLDQAAMHRFCEAGHYERYLRRLHTTYRRRMQALVRGLKRHMPAGCATWTEPLGGCTLWLRAVSARPVTEAAILERAHAERVLVTPGSYFVPDTPTTACFRLSIARAKVHEIDEGCRRLARAVKP
jgi:DNA-binding transcriptional MocR family regulator